MRTLFLENEVQINRNNYGTMLFMSKQVSLPKISLILQKMKIGQKFKFGLPKISSILQKMKIGQKFDIRPFCTKPFNCES